MKLNLRLARLFGIGMFLTILSFTILQAQEQPWRAIGPWGGNITAIKMKTINDSTLTVVNGGSLADSIVVGSYGAGVFITGPLNGTGAIDWAAASNVVWVPRNNGLPSLKVLSLAVRNIGQSDTMYVGLDGSGIYKTVNAGLTWERAFGLGDAMSRRSVYDIAIHPNTSWVAYAATNQGLWKTTNFGVVWSQVIPGANATFTKVQMHEFTTQKIYATSGGLLYRSTDTGNSWSNHAITGAQITAMALAFSALDTIYVGCDNGTVHEVTFPPDGIFYPGVPPGSFTVTEKSRGLVPGNSVTDMAIIPSYAGQGGGTFSTVGRDSIIGNDTIYMTTAQGVFKSDRKGSTWTQVNKGLQSTNTSVIAVKPVYDPAGTFPGPWGGDHTNPYLVMYHDVFVGTSLGGLYTANTQMNQAGAVIEWTKIDRGIPVAGLRAVSVTPTYSSTVYAGGGYLMGNGLASGAVYKTFNGDDPNPDWIIVYPPATSTDGLYVMDISTDWEDKGYVMIADSILGLIKSVDSGATFTVLPNTASARSVYINRMHGDTMFAGRSNGTNQLLRSYNAFETFDAITLPYPGNTYPITCITMDTASGQRTQSLYVGTLGGGVYKSTDLGATFTEINNGVSNRVIFSISVGSGADSNYIVAGTSFGSYSSTDGGANWSDNNGGAFLDEVPGVYTVRGDSTWAVFLNHDTRKNTGIFYYSESDAGWEDRDPNSYDEDGIFGGPGTATFDLAGAPVQTPLGYFLSNGALLMSDIDMMWQWETPSEIAGYAASETWAIFARNNKGVGIANGVTIVNIIGGENSGDSILIWIPDTLSSLRGEGATGEDFFDIPIFVRNLQRADSIIFKIFIPSSHFEEAGAPYINTGTAPTGVQRWPIITEGTITEGFIISDTSDPRRRTGGGRGFISFGTEAGDMTVKFSDSTLINVSSRGKFRADRDVLLKIRVSIRQKASSIAQTDSIPRASGGAAAAVATDLFLARTWNFDGPGPTVYSKLRGSDRFPMNADTTAAIPMEDAKFAAPKEDDGSTIHRPLDSIAVFWLRREPGGGVHDAINDLPGTLHVDSTLFATTVNMLRGEVSNTYTGTANFTSDRLWNYRDITGGSMVIGIIGGDVTYPYLTYDGFPELPIRTGDAIGAFYYRNDSLVNGGWGTWVPGGVAFSIHRDDDRTQIKDGFVEEEKIYFKIYDSRYKKVWDVEDVTFTSGPAEYHSGLTARITSMRAKNYITSNIQLRAGWNLISANIIPRFPEMETIFKRPAVSRHLTLVKDENGLVYWPEIDLNQLPYWDIEEAYWVHMYSVVDSLDDLTMQGGTIDVTRNSIALRRGWNLLPYWGTIDGFPLTTALSALISFDRDSMMVKDEDGRIYWAALGYDDIKVMRIGKGYELYLSTDYPEFRYPTSVLATNMRSIDNGKAIPGLTLEKKSVASIYKPTITPVSQVLAFKVEGYKLNEGDEIGIFTRDGICVGSGKFDNGASNVIALSVFGDVPITEGDNKVGAIEGDELIVKLYSRTDEQEYTPVIKNVEWVGGSGSGLFFKSRTIASASVEVLDAVTSFEALPTEFAIAQNYPNPFNPTTNIKYQLPVDGLVKIKIFDMLGREVRTLVNQDQKAGYYTIEWDATNNSGRKAASGVYFYQIEASNFKKTMKMMLMK